MWSTAARAKCAFRSIRCGRRRRSTRSASTITRRSPTGATAPTHLDRALTDIDLRSRLSRRQSARRRGLRLVLRRRRRARCADAHADHRRARQAVGVPRQGSLELVGATRITSASAAPSLAAPTAWVPQCKPIWLTEVGCPAVDKGANQPSVFPDPKSSEGGAAVFLQRRARRPDPAPLSRSRARRVRSGLRREPSVNPVSTVYGGRMIDAGRDSSVDLGRAALSGVSGRHRCVERRAELGDRPLADRPARRGAARCAGRDDSAPTAASSGVDTSALGEGADGYVIDRPMAPRAMLEPLALAYAFDAAETDGVLRFPPARRRAGGRVRRGRSGAAGGQRAGAADARAGNRTAARSRRIGYTDLGDDYQPRGRELAPAGRRLDAQRRMPISPW